MTTAGLVIACLLAAVDVVHASRIPAAKQAWQWRYQVWMPAHWQRLAQCEEHLDWRHHGSGYEGAFAFATGTWDRYRPARFPVRAWMATPWQQFFVARIVARIYTIGGAWGCWRGPQHAWVRGGLPEHGVRS